MVSIPRRAGLLAAALVTLYVVGIAPSLGQPLVETHAYRQTQTAYTAVIYADRGIDLLRPPLPVLGPPGDIPQEFPIFQAAAAGLIVVGVPPDLAARLVGLATFLACAVLLWLLSRRLMGDWAALITLAAFLFNAHAWVYGRTSLIEYLAAAGGIGFLYFSIRWMEASAPASWVAAFLSGSIGILVKITTGAFFLLPILFWRSPDGRWGFQRAPMVALVGAVMAIGLAWSAWAQGVREETPASVFLSLENQVAWFLGTVGMRFDPGAWRVPFVAMLALSGFGIIVWGAIATRAAWRHRQAPFLLTLLALFAGMPLLLFNLYATHDYYWVAVAPILALAIGLSAGWLRSRWSSPSIRRLGVALAGAWIATLVGSFASWSIVYGEPPELAGTMRIADFVRDHSEPDDWVVFRGWGWNPTFLYYARRQGLAVPEARPDSSPLVEGQDLSDIDLDRILADPSLGPFIFCDSLARCEVESRPSEGR